MLEIKGIVRDKGKNCGKEETIVGVNTELCLKGNCRRCGILEENIKWWERIKKLERTENYT